MLGVNKSVGEGGKNISQILIKERVEIIGAGLYIINKYRVKIWCI